MHWIENEISVMNKDLIRNDLTYNEKGETFYLWIYDIFAKYFIEFGLRIQIRKKVLINRLMYFYIYWSNILPVFLTKEYSCL